MSKIEFKQNKKEMTVNLFILKSNKRNINIHIDTDCIRTSDEDEDSDSDSRDSDSHYCDSDSDSHYCDSGCCSDEESVYVGDDYVEEYMSDEDKSDK